MKIKIVAACITGFLISFAAAAAAAQKDILILFSEDRGLTKSVDLYDFNDWFASKHDNTKQASALLKEGWSLLQIVPVASNPKQYYWIFVK